jgi:hypothetical protein
MARLEQRGPRAHRGRGGLSVEVDGDIRRGTLREVGEALVVEGRYRTEARVLVGELSPAGAGLVYLEGSRQGPILVRHRRKR